MDQVIIEVASNESQRREDNPNIPYTPEEIERDARRCIDAGASIMHYHARGRDGHTCGATKR